MSSIKVYSAEQIISLGRESVPYSEKRNVPVITNKKSIGDYFYGLNTSELLFYFLAFITGLVYVIIEPCVSYSNLVCCQWFSKRDGKKNNYCKSTERSEGIISENKTEPCVESRQYQIRHLKFEHDLIAASNLFLSSFSVDPFYTFLKPDILVKRNMGAQWFQIQMLSYTADTLVQEWKDQEKLVGAAIFSQRPGTCISEFIDAVRIVSFCLRQVCLSPKCAYRILHNIFSLTEKYKAVSLAFGEKVCGIKFLSVEKGFQGQGIGSGLLESVLKHVDALGLFAYLEASHLRNVRLYEKYGFRVFEEYKFNSEAKPLYLMIRVPLKQLNSDAAAEHFLSTSAASNSTPKVSHNPNVSGTKDTATPTESLLASFASPDPRNSNFQLAQDDLLGTQKTVTKQAELRSFNKPPKD